MFRPFSIIRRIYSHYREVNSREDCMQYIFWYLYQRTLLPTFEISSLEKILPKIQWSENSSYIPSASPRHTDKKCLQGNEAYNTQNQKLLLAPPPLIE